MSRPRVFLLGAALLVLLLALTPLIPRGDDGDGLRPSGRQQSWDLADAPGAGKVTPAMRAEIDRVVDEARTVGRTSGKPSPEALVDELVRCADLEGQTYCLGLGWTDQTESEVRARMRVAARSARTSTAETTGDLDVLGELRRTASLSPAARARAERAELVMAARSVAKVWMLRHAIQGVPLPADFLERTPRPEQSRWPEAVATRRTTPPPHRATARRPTRPRRPRRRPGRPCP